jgi:tRNA dimethylallyltransferase
MHPALLILGPTASGKSALALALAQRIGAMIVNADSMQVYRDLAILTARPTPEEQARTPHRLYGVIDGGERYSTGRWLADAGGVLSEARSHNQAVIIVGGTGLYFKALTEGLAQTPPVPADIQNALIGALATLGAPALHAQLEARDREGAALLSPQDGPRVTRALAVLEATGRPLRAWQAEQAPPLLAPGAWLGVTLRPARPTLYAAIAARFSAMIARGALPEAERFLARRLDPSLPLMKAHGLPWLAEHLSGALSLEDAIAGSVRDTRRYAKRQFTWMAGQTHAWAPIVAEDPADRVAAVMSLWRP